MFDMEPLPVHQALACRPDGVLGGADRAGVGPGPGPDDAVFLVSILTIDAPHARQIPTHRHKTSTRSSQWLSRLLPSHVNSL